MHLARSATGNRTPCWHLKAGIACEHAIAPSVQETGWDRIIGFYQVLAQRSWSPIVALNRALAVAERDGIGAGRRELIALAGEQKLSRYPFYRAARADLERRAGCHPAAREHCEQAIALARSPAERVSFERRIESPGIPWRVSGFGRPARLADVARKRHRRSIAMRKIINSAFVWLDGAAAGPSSWAIFDPDAAEEAAQSLHALGGTLMGRGTCEYFADVMPEQAGPFADAMNASRNCVFSSTLETADWNNSTLIRDDVVTAVTELKQDTAVISRCTDTADPAKPCSPTTWSVKSGSRSTRCWSAGKPAAATARRSRPTFSAQPPHRTASSPSPTSLPPAERQGPAWPQARRASTKSAPATSSAAFTSTRPAARDQATVSAACASAESWVRADHAALDRASTTRSSRTGTRLAV
jgi:hypothetical protein